MRLSKMLLILLLLTLILMFWLFDGQQYLSLTALQRQQLDFQAYQQAHPWLAGVWFFLMYVGITALSLPGAVLMSLAAGAIFGGVWGVLLVSFAASLGATLAFLSARFLLREGLVQRFPTQIEMMDQGMKKEGAYYLFSLRLVPLLPFFLINVLMGLTPIRLVTYYWVSQLGMLPGAVVYVNAGQQLAQIQQPSDIFSPMLIASFVLLGLLPWLARYVLHLLRP